MKFIYDLARSELVRINFACEYMFSSFSQPADPIKRIWKSITLTDDNIVAVQQHKLFHWSHCSIMVIRVVVYCRYLTLIFWCAVKWLNYHIRAYNSCIVNLQHDRWYRKIYIILFIQGYLKLSVMLIFWIWNVTCVFIYMDYTNCIWFI